MNHLDSLVDAYKGKFIYEFDNQIQMNWYPKRVIHRCKPEHVTLELGLGHGISTSMFSEYFNSYSVIDASEAVISNFKKKFPRSQASIVKSYFENFTTSERYDVIIMGFVLEHVDNPEVVLQHFKQFLKDNGRIFITVPNAEVMNRRLGVFAKDLSDVHLLSDHDHACGHQRYYTLKSLTEQVELCGYRILSTEGVYLKPLSTRQMIALELQPKYIEALCELGVLYPELSCSIFMEIELIR